MATRESGEGAEAGVTTQVRETGQEVVAKAQEQLQEKTEQVRGEAGERVRKEVDRRSTELGEHGQSLAEALRGAGQDLDSQGKQAPARVLHSAADKVEQVSGYLHDSDAGRMLGDVEGRARQRPWVAAGIGAFLGFVASRFVKASSARRYEQQGRNGYRSGYTRELEQAGSRESEVYGGL